MPEWRKDCLNIMPMCQICLIPTTFDVFVFLTIRVKKVPT